jgi:hypothetical protein
MQGGHNTKDASEKRVSGSARSKVDNHECGRSSGGNTEQDPICVYGGQYINPVGLPVDVFNEHLTDRCKDHRLPPRLATCTNCGELFGVN